MPISSSHPYTKTEKRVPWDNLMAAQMPSGNSGWFVTVDHLRGVIGGRMVNIRTRDCVNWTSSADGKGIKLSASLWLKNGIPAHCIKTALRLTRMASHEDLRKAAKADIEIGLKYVYDLASEHGQIFDNVKEMSWFVRHVEDSLIKTCRKFWHLAPNYGG